ncbi:uncharacterized protein [Apostichopus japonicus]|uniref:uncharacterized protein n=1 Tax=Stichopus japonicus TaxID=307972 RepID=UPI003AB5907B
MEPGYNASFRPKQFLPPICMSIRLQNHFDKGTYPSPETVTGGLRSVLDNPPTTPWDERPESRIYGNEEGLTPHSCHQGDYSKKTWPFLKQKRPRWWFRNRKDTVSELSRDRRVGGHVNQLKHSCLETHLPSQSSRVCTHDPCRVFVRLQNMSMATTEKGYPPMTVFANPTSTLRGLCSHDQIAQDVLSQTCAENHETKSDLQKLCRISNVAKHKFKKRKRDVLAARTKDDFMLSLPSVQIKAPNLKSTRRLSNQKVDVDYIYQPFDLTLRDIVMTRPWQTLIRLDDSRKVTSDVKQVWSKGRDLCQFSGQK